VTGQRHYAGPRPGQPDAQLVRLFELFVRLYAAQKGADLDGKLSALTLRWGNQNNQSVGIKDGGVTRQRRDDGTFPHLSAATKRELSGRAVQQPLLPGVGRPTDDISGP